MIKSDLAMNIPNSNTTASVSSAIQNANDLASNVKTENTETTPTPSAGHGVDETPGDNTPSAVADKATVEQVIRESANIVIALENVGALYGVPTHNVTVDNTLSTIKVNGDNITAPELPVNQTNAKAVVMAIGAVLDNISQRIDQKLDKKQDDEIVSRQLEDNASLGTLVYRDYDDDNNLVTAYDSGVINHANTKTSTKKAIEIRQSLNLKYPDKVVDQPQYFTDEDDITKDINMDAVTNEYVGMDLDDRTIDVADSIQEESFHLDNIARFGDTSHLGYELLQEQGFDYIKPTTQPTVIQEASNSKKKRRNKDILSQDIKHLKFDNKNLMKAIKHFNLAYMEMKIVEGEPFDTEAFMNSKNYQKGLDFINSQFDCRAIVRFFANSPTHDNDFIATAIYNDSELKPRLVISKSKGFQMNKLPVHINIGYRGIERMCLQATTNGKIFGHLFTAIILHEIFHNIAMTLKVQNGSFKNTLALTLSIASDLPNVSDKRIVFTNFVNTIDHFKNIKMNRLSKQLLVKQLLLTSMSVENNKDLATIGLDEKHVSKYDANDDVRSTVKGYKKLYNRLSFKKKFETATGFIYAAVLIVPTFGFSLLLWMKMMQELDSVYNMKAFEEYYCDLFAGLYNLPVVFFIETEAHRYTPNDIDSEILKELNDVNLDIHKLVGSVYPTSIERTNASVKIAKQMLSSKTKLNKDVKHYLQWIVDNFDSTENIEIDEIYNDKTFDPKIANNLDKHLQDLISNDNIPLTESFNQDTLL